MVNEIPQFLTITTQGIRPIYTTELVTSDNPILNEVMPFFDFKKDDPIGMANTLIEALQKHKGLGLSANQIGLRKRCFVAGIEDNVVAYFNPEIINASSETELLDEGCLSFPGLRLKIRRPVHIEMRYQDYTGQWHQIVFEGMTARVLQHETNHLDGITFKDKAGPMALKIGLKKWKKNQK